MPRTRRVRADLQRHRLKYGRCACVKVARRHRVLVVGAGTQPSPDDEAEAPVGNGRAIAVQCAREGAEVVLRRPRRRCRRRDRGDDRRSKAGRAACSSATCDPKTRARPSSLMRRGSEVGPRRRRVQRRHRAGRWPRGHVAPTTGTRRSSVNLRSHFLVARAALPVLNPVGRSCSSVPSRASSPAAASRRTTHRRPASSDCAATSRSKAPGREVRANVLAPGFIDTPLGRNASRGRPSRDRTPVPLGRQGTAWEVASVVDVPALVRRQLRDRPGPPRRRRPHPDLR